jgi:hypothetical protein
VMSRADFQPGTLCADAAGKSIVMRGGFAPFPFELP